MRECVWCGDEFEPNPTRRQIYCSRQCTNRATSYRARTHHIRPLRVEGLPDLPARDWQPMEWAERAACRQADTNTFFPPRGSRDVAAEAKAVCATCPVRQPCLDYALEGNERHGIWGGLTEKERRPLRARQWSDEATG